MSNKLEINRDRLFTNGYRKYLQSLTHGALVDFILTGGNLSFTPSQERSLLLDELADEKARHSRATDKINSLVRENRELRTQIEALEPVNTVGSFATGAAGLAADVGTDSIGQPLFRVIDLETNNVLYEGDTFPVTEDDFAQTLISLIFGGLQTGAPVEAKRYTSIAEYTADYPDAVSVASIGAADTTLSENVINACDSLMERFEPYVEAGSLAHGVGIVQIACRDAATGEAFVDAATAVDVKPVTFATYVLNHMN